MKSKRNTPETAPFMTALSEGIEKSKDSVHDLLLAGLGALGRAQKAGKERAAELVAEGRKVEPRVKRAIQDWRAKMRLDGKSGLRAPAWFDGDKVRRLASDRVESALRHTGLPLRKDVEALSRKLDKLIELQRT